MLSPGDIVSFFEAKNMWHNPKLNIGIVLEAHDDPLVTRMRLTVWSPDVGVVTKAAWNFELECGIKR